MEKVVVVSGASRGIGLGLVKRFGAMPGFIVLALSRNIKPLQELAEGPAWLGTGSRLIPIWMDLAEPHPDFDSLTGWLKQEQRSVHILINNAGFLEKSPFQSSSANLMLRTLQVNFLGSALLTQALLPFLLEGDGVSHVVNIGSMGGFKGSVKFPGLSAYSASKAALACLAECLAAEYPSELVRFNTLCLGSVQTEMLQEAFPGYQAPLTVPEMAGFIVEFALTGWQFMNGKTLPVSVSTP